MAPLDLLPAWELPAADARAPQIAFTARAWTAFDTPGVVARWDALAQWSAEPNAFYESCFLLPSLRALDPAGEVELLCLEADGQLAGLLPIRRERRYYGYPLPHWRNWLHANMFVGTPLVAVGFEAAFWRGLFAWCDARGGAPLFLHLAHVPTVGPLHDALATVLAEERRSAATVLREERAMLRSRLDPEEYFELSLSAKKRKELRRQHRRLAEEGTLEVERSADAIGLDAWIDEFLALERAGWKGDAGSALACDATTERLFADALKGAARRGRLERLAIRLDGAPLAMLASFLCPPGVFSFKTAFDERFARFSPGVLLQRENLRLLGRSDVAWADSCAAAGHPMIDHFWRERRTIARHNVAIGGTGRRLLFRALAAYETDAGAGGVG
jgi:CelD/BcsL family acetyltransferase involved in cellulose biosynthesis